MKKEIGSIFPLSDSVLRGAETELPQYPNDRLYYSLCREALFDIARAIKSVGCTALIPAYTCQTVITPFEEVGWRCEYYSVHKDLRIDIVDLLSAIERYHPLLVVVHPYFGMDLNEKEMYAFSQIKEKGIEIVVDLTQCLFSTKQYPFASFLVASYRKWLPIPDGGYLKKLTKEFEIIQPDNENTEFDEKVISAMYLRSLYFEQGEQRTKDISIRLSKSADTLVENNIVPHRMSKVAHNLLNRENLEINQKCRLGNYTFLFNNVHESERIIKVCKRMSNVTTAPLYFAVFVDDRASLQRHLANSAIYAPIIWPVEDERVLISEEVKYIYDHLLAIPCDQRYDEEDMLRMVEIINNY